MPFSFIIGICRNLLIDVLLIKLKIFTLKKTDSIFNEQSSLLMLCLQNPNDVFKADGKEYGMGSGGLLTIFFHDRKWSSLLFSSFKRLSLYILEP